MNESPDKPSMKEDPMVAQDQPANKMKRGLLYGGIVVVVIIVLLIAINMSVKNSKTMDTSPVSDSSYSTPTLPDTVGK